MITVTAIETGKARPKAAQVNARQARGPVGRVTPGRVAVSARDATGGRADSQEAHSAGGLMVSVAGKWRARRLCQPGKNSAVAPLPASGEGTVKRTQQRDHGVAETHPDSRLSK